MSLRFCDSFDHYQTADIERKWTTLTGTGTIQSGGRNGNCFRASGTDRLDITIDNQDVWIVGFAFKVATLPSSDYRMVAFYDTAGSAYQCALKLDNSGCLRFGRYNGSTYTDLGISASSLSTGVWYHIEVKVTIANSGSYEVRVNGSNWLSGSGDTQYTANAQANSIRIGAYLAGYNYWDDLYICDDAGSYNNDFRGDSRVGCYFPDVDGTNTDFTCSTGSDHYALVDESATDFPNDDTDYVESNTVGHKDTYACEDAGYDPGETAVDGVQVLVCAKKTGSGDKTMCPVVRYDGTDYDGNNAYPSDGAYAYIRQVYERVPDGSSDPWTPTNINASEFGQKVVA